MANEEHFLMLLQGVEAWNRWREEHPETKPDLSGANLERANLRRANLREAWFDKAHLLLADFRDANLCGADFTSADLRAASFRNADLSEAQFRNANLYGANLYGANLVAARLDEAQLVGASLRGADLTGASLQGATLIETDLTDATLTDCRVYGVSAWDVKLARVKDQSNLRITLDSQPAITVDDVEVAQFVYLLLNNEKIRRVIDTIGEKGVLILGRFTKERKAVLNAIRNRLRELGFVPMMFDFERPTQRDFTETIKTLAGMSRFIIADITNPKSSPLELQATMPDYMIPFVPIIQEDERPFTMFRDLKQKYGEWVLDVLEYDTAESLLRVFEGAVVKPALEKGRELLLKKAEAIQTRHVRDYK